jgi:hypothetical protein
VSQSNELELELGLQEDWNCTVLIRTSQPKFPQRGKVIIFFNPCKIKGRKGITQRKKSRWTLKGDRETVGWISSHSLWGN